MHKLLSRSYKSLSPRTRIYLGLGLMANAALYLTFSEQIESVLGVRATEDEDRRLRETLPRVRTFERPSDEAVGRSKGSQNG